MTDLKEAPKKAPETRRWLCSCDHGGGTNVFDDDFAANYLVHCQVVKDLAQAKALMDERAKLDGEILIKRLPHGLPGRLAYLRPNAPAPQHSPKVKHRGG